MLSRRITTSFLCSTRRLAFSKTISATCTCRCAGSSNVEEMTSPFTLRCMSVTSSGRSSMSRTMRTTSGWFFVRPFAMLWRMIVFPARGGEGIRAPCPFPVGVLGVDLLHLEEGEIPLVPLGRPDLPRHRVAGAESEPADLGGRDVDVVGPRQVIRIGGPQEGVPVGGNPEDSLAGHDDLLAGSG